MKTLLLILLTSPLAIPALAQTGVPEIPEELIKTDSVRRILSPEVARLGTTFYHRSGDPPDVVRAALDNMPIKQSYSLRRDAMPNPFSDQRSRYRLPLPDSLRLNPNPRSRRH